MRFPTTLQMVAEQTAAGRPFHLALGEFLDRFYAQPDVAALLAEPRRLRDVLSESGDVYDAYLAATAECLAQGLGAPGPAWARSPDRALSRPWFASRLASLRALLILESPAPFRARNLFVSANALSRA